MTTGLIEKSASTPRYRQLKNIICREIRKNNLQAGKRVGSVAQLSAMHKVSRATVVRAFSELVDEGVLYSQVGMGTFVADPAGKKTHTICFVVYSGDYITLPYFSQIVAGISEVTEAKHYNLQFITSARVARTIDGHSPHSSIKKEGKWTDGLIIMDNCLPDDQIVRLADALPVLLVNRTLAGTDVACVRSDDSGGTYGAIRHLASLGHKRIGMIIDSYPWLPESGKMTGYHSAVRELGLDDDPDLVRYSSGEDGLKGAVDVLLSSSVQPTAIFASDDTFAFEILQILREKNIKVPQDMAVISFGGSLSGVLRGQQLTTMQLPIVEMGRTAARMLLARIAKEELPRNEMVFAPKLVVKQSCGTKVSV